jgi:hypothetical protein
MLQLELKAIMRKDRHGMIRFVFVKFSGNLPGFSILSSDSSGLAFKMINGCADL